MAIYSFYRLPDLDEDPIRLRIFSDEAAGRYALSVRFPSGCDVWEGTRFVGRYHGNTVDSQNTDPADTK